MTHDRVPPNRLRRTVAALAAVAALTATGVACGDDDDADTPPETSVGDDSLREGDVAPGAGAGDDEPGVEDESGLEGGAPGTNPPASR